MKRSQNRAANALRNVQFERNFSLHAEGSVLAYFGDTLVMCTATVENGVPRFLRGSKKGWLTAEYSMLPRATKERNKREVIQGKQNGRTQEIQRLIGRSLRAAIDLHALGDYTITIDCDVLQADGGTRCAAITGGYVALFDALRKIEKLHVRTKAVAAVSVGIIDNHICVDLDYNEDVRAMTDMNIVMDDNQGFIEIQGTAEKQNFSKAQLHHMLDSGTQAIQKLCELQTLALQ